MRNNLFQTLHLKVIKPKIDTDQRKTIKNSEIYTCEKVICIKNIHRKIYIYIHKLSTINITGIYNTLQQYIHFCAIPLKRIKH